MPINSAGEKYYLYIKFYIHNWAWKNGQVCNIQLSVQVPGISALKKNKSVKAMENRDNISSMHY